jgi:hypothetical protein
MLFMSCMESFSKLPSCDNYLFHNNFFAVKHKYQKEKIFDESFTATFLLVRNF